MKAKEILNNHDAEIKKIEIKQPRYADTNIIISSKIYDENKVEYIAF